MFNQVFSMIFGNRASDSRSEVTHQASSNSQSSKKRTAAEMEERAAKPVAKRVSESEFSPVKKKVGRPPLKKNQPQSLKNRKTPAKNMKEETEESDPESEEISHKGKRKAQASSASDYDGSNDDDSEPETPGRGVRRSSRSAAMSTTPAQQTPAAVQRTSSDASGGYSSYMSSALMRRSRRSRTVDLSKALVVMLPGDDPREVAQLDLRGEIEWEEFLLAMSEDTTFMTSDNEEGPAEHLAHSSSTWSLNGMTGADGPPTRSRNSSATFVASPLPSAANLKSTVGMDAQRLQYNDVMSVNVAATASEVHIPEVKDAALYKVLTAINLLDDPLRSSAAVTATIPTTKSRGGKTKDSDLHELAQQVLIDKRCGGYDCAFHIMPEHLRRTSEVYVDYDADSDDEQFARDLQVKLTHPRSPRHTASPSVSKKTAAATPDTSSHASDHDVEFKVRCLELMIARLEREFELSRQFTSQLGGGAAVMPRATKVPIAVAVPVVGAAPATVPPPGKKSVMVQLTTTLEQAQATYELAKRFIKQPPKMAKTSKHPSRSKQSPPAASAVVATGRFSRHGNANSTATSDSSPVEAKIYDFTALEKLHRLNLQRLNLPTTGSSANLADLSLTLQSLPLVRASSVTEDAPPPPRRVGRPPLIPRIPQGARAADLKPQKEKEKEVPEEVTRDPYVEYYTEEQISILMPAASTVVLLQNILRNFYGVYLEQAESGELGSAVKAKLPIKGARLLKSRSNSIASVAESETDQSLLPVSVFGVERELIIVHEVYLHWRKKRSEVSTSLIRAYHNYIMELWQRADTVALPVPGDFQAGTLAESRQHLIQVRRSLDRARLITDRVRRRERLKRDILRLSGDQLDVLRAELSTALVPALSGSPGNLEKPFSSPESRSVMDTSEDNYFSSAVSPPNQERDSRGKFFKDKNAPPKNTAKALAPSASTGSLNGGGKNAVKSVKNQEIVFSIEPSSEDEASVDEESSELSDDQFSDCASETESEAEPEVVSVPPSVFAIPAATSTPVTTVKKEKGDEKMTSPSVVLKAENTTPSSIAESAGKKNGGDSTQDREKEVTKELSPAVSSHSQSSGGRSSRAASTTTPETASSTAIVGKGRRKNAIFDSEDEFSEDFDRTEHLSVRGGRSQQNTPAPTPVPASRTPASASAPTTADKTRGRSNTNGAHNSIVVAAQTRSTPARPLQPTSGTKKTPLPGGDSSKKNSRTRGVPDCSLRNLPFSATKTPSSAAADSANKKRRLQ